MTVCDIVAMESPLVPYTYLEFLNIEDYVFPSSLRVMHTRPNPSFKREPAATSSNIHDAPGITEHYKSYVPSSALIDSQSRKRRRQEKDEEKKKRAHKIPMNTVSISVMLLLREKET